MVYGVLKLINFAHGDVMMVGVYMGYATAFALGRRRQKTLLGVVLIFLVAMGGCALLGFLIERFAYRPLREKPRLTALITAIGISFALSYGFQLDIGFLPGAAPRAFPEIIRPNRVAHHRRPGRGGVELAGDVTAHRGGADGGAAVPGVQDALRPGDARGVA